MRAVCHDRTVLDLESAPPDPAAPLGEMPAIAPDIRERLAQLSPTPLAADTSHLTPADHRVLAATIAAARELNAVFLRQVSPANPGLERLLAAASGPLAAAARAYFAINFGPWDRLDAMRPFVGDRPHPEGEGYYPEDMTREELERWMAVHPGDREAFLSPVTAIRRRGEDLVAVPYCEEYRTWLGPAAERLRAAGAATENASLKRYLETRAAAFLSNDYYPSDLAWLDVDAPIEVTIGPYETYGDGLFGYKAAFEAFVTVALPAVSAALARYKERLPWLERNLPIPDGDKNLHRGAESPIRVVDLAYAAGDAAAGVQALAFNLPNDERVREAKGLKNVLLHNVMRAKYDKILLPVAALALAPGDAGRVTFDAYFHEVLHHELSHGMGPGTIEVGGRRTEVRLELKELYSTLEEAKADVMGIYNLLALAGQGAAPREIVRALEPTYVAGLVRAARFGIDEAHGQGVVAQLNYLLAKGALVEDGEARFHAVSERFPAAIRDLLHDILTLQAAGDYAGTKRFLATYGEPGPALRTAIGRLAGLPVDIRPEYAADEAR